MSGPLAESTNVEELRQRQKKLVEKSRAAFEDNDSERSLKLLKRAYDLCPNEKLKRKIERLEEFMKTEENDDREEDDSVMMKRKQLPGVEKVEVAPGLQMRKQLFDRLYGHQREGITWLWRLHKEKKGGILADDMGLGKTVQIVTFLNALFEAERLRHALIVMPVSVMLTWDREFEVWGSRKLQVLHFHEDSKKQRLRNLRKIQRSSGVLLTTYGMIMTSAEEFSTREDGRDFEWDYVILDEGHKIKNKSNKTTKAVHATPAKHRIIMTGTAIQNNLMELWSLFDFVHFGGLLGTQKSFKMHFEAPILRSRQRDASSGERHYGAQMAESLKKRIAPYFLRRTKAQVTEKASDVNKASNSEAGAKMPVLSRKNDFVVWVYLSEVQEKIYRDFLQLDVIKELLVPSNKRSPLMELTILKKICDHPRLLSTFQCVQLGLEGDRGMVDLESEHAHQCAANRVEAVENDVLMMESGKVTFVSQLMDQLKKEGHRALIFSQSRKMLDIIEKVLNANNHRLLRLDGTVTNLSQRQELIKRFTDHPGRYSAFLLTTQVGGIGLTLTAADRVIIIDPSWNPATDNQAVDRAFRIGQNKNVVIYRLITCGTVEEKIYRRQIFKESITRQTTGIRNTDRDPYRYFTGQQLRELFSLTSPRHSETQRQLDELHSAHRVTDCDLDAHIAFLHSLDVFGLSDHDLMFSCEDEPPAEEAVSELGDAMARMTITTQHVAEMRARAERQLNIESGMNVEERDLRLQMDRLNISFKPNANSTFVGSHRPPFSEGGYGGFRPVGNSTFINPREPPLGKGPGSAKSSSGNTFTNPQRVTSSSGIAWGVQSSTNSYDPRRFPNSAGPLGSGKSVTSTFAEPRRAIPPVFAPSRADTQRAMFNRPASQESITWKQTRLEDLRMSQKLPSQNVPSGPPIVISSDSDEEVVKTAREVEKQLELKGSSNVTSTSENKRYSTSESKEVSTSQNKQDLTSENVDDSGTMNIQDSAKENRHDSVIKNKENSTSESNDNGSEIRDDSVIVNFQDSARENKRDSVMKNKEESPSQSKDDCNREENQDLTSESSGASVNEIKQNSTNRNKEESTIEIKRDSVSENIEAAVSENKRESVYENTEDWGNWSSESGNEDSSYSEHSDIEEKTRDSTDESESEVEDNSDSDGQSGTKKAIDSMNQTSSSRFRRLIVEDDSDESDVGSPKTKVEECLSDRLKDNFPNTSVSPYFDKPLEMHRRSSDEDKEPTYQKRRSPEKSAGDDLEESASSDNKELETFPSSPISRSSDVQWEMQELSENAIEEHLHNPDIIKILSRSLVSSTPNTPARNRTVFVENSWHSSEALESTEQKKADDDSGSVADQFVSAESDILVIEDSFEGNE